ncbi:pseudouridine synthase [Dongia sp.]|jgi:23S rRNA pseudouridine2605 synthase|uniref:pseudouridine synthase n=1 Tax=Dongia sp. TaxID=1977262 RepID=UPI0035B0FA11
MSQLDRRPKKEQPGERIAKVMARAGLCSRRDAEVWIANGRVSINGKILTSAAMNVGTKDIVLVDGKPLPEKQLTRVWLYYKPKGLMTTAYDPEGRATVFENLPADMPRVISIGRLDLNSEGLLLLTNDGELARKLELPSTAWIRRYRVRVNGRFDPKLLDGLKDGIEIEGVRYGPIIAAFERQQGANAWLTMALTEGKNREIRRICQHFGWPVSRLIRVGYGPFQLGDMEPGQVQEVKGKQLQTQLRFGNDWRPPEKAEAEETYTARPAFDRGPDKRTREKHAVARGERPERSARPERVRTQDEGAPARNQRPGRNARLARGDKPGWTQKPERQERGERPVRATREERNERPVRPERVGKPQWNDRPRSDEKPRRAERAQRDERPEITERPRRNDRGARNEQAVRSDRPDRRDRPQRDEAPNRAPKTGLKPGWAKNKPEKPQPGTRRKPIHARAEGDDFTKREERPPQEWKSGGKPRSDRPRDDKPSGDKSWGGKPQRGKPHASKPHGSKPHGDKRRDDGVKGDRPRGKPGGGKSGSGRPGSGNARRFR